MQPSVSARCGCSPVRLCSWVSPNSLQLWEASTPESPQLVGDVSLSVCLPCSPAKGQVVAPLSPFCIVPEGRGANRDAMD